MELTVKQLAPIILQAQGIYENSWDVKNQRYTMRYNEAVTIALVQSSLPVQQYVVDLISLLLSALWNDAMLWAEEVNKL